MTELGSLGTIAIPDDDAAGRDTRAQRIRCFRAIPYPCTTLIISIATIFLATAAFYHEELRICAFPPEAYSSARDMQPETCLNPVSYLVIWIALVILLALCNDAPPDLVLLFATVVFVVLPDPFQEPFEGEARTIISPSEAWAGFSSEPILAVGSLFVFARAVEETRVVEMLIKPLLGSPTNHNVALLRLVVPTSLFSAFLNNTPIVAMLISVCESWCEKTGLSLGVILMPLSFASILGMWHPHLARMLWMHAVRACFSCQSWAGSPARHIVHQVGCARSLARRRIWSSTLLSRAMITRQSSPSPSSR